MSQADTFKAEDPPVYVHIPTPSYPTTWTPQDAADVWETSPRHFGPAARAWARAAGIASAFYPIEFERLLWRYGENDLNFRSLVELHNETVHRTNWVLPGEDPFWVFTRSAEVWQRRTTFGLLWETSVQTILARTAPGWVVRIIGQHEERRRAAEMVL